MVKVKDANLRGADIRGASFNHPMVKVKGERVELVEIINKCFNHPMVKVKAEMQTSPMQTSEVSTTLW